MMEKGWYGPAVMTLLATFVGFLYMARFIQAIFLGRRKATHKDLTEAPIALLVPQYLLVAGILLMSFFPKLLIEPVSRAIDPQFASTLVWQGMSLEMIYGYWNPMPVMALAVTASAILFGTFWVIRRAGWIKLPGGGSKIRDGSSRAAFFDFYRPAFTMLTPPWAIEFWGGLTTATVTLADRARLVYSGNGQTYNLYILYYFVVLYVAGGGLRHP
jgi:NADH:ubiquinone oxidoreductase subunit 5 (subunit L)/multisubunit Na+/H+ antiporter MnhA subunit